MKKRKEVKVYQIKAIIMVEISTMEKKYSIITTKKILLKKRKSIIISTKDTTTISSTAVKTRRSL